MHRRTVVKGSILVAAAALLAGPAAAQEATPEAVATPAADVATVRVVHASPDAPAVDVLVNGQRAITDLEFGQATPFVPLPAGEYDLQVVPAGAEAADAVIDAPDVALEGGQAYQVAAVGLLANIQPQITTVDLSPLADDTARVRVVHASPDAPAIDVAVTGGDVLFSNIEFPNAGDYAEVPAASYDLEVRPTGAPDVVLPLPGVALEGGTVYDVFAIGLAGDGSLDVLVLTAPAMAEGMATPTA